MQQTSLKTTSPVRPESDPRRANGSTTYPAPARRNGSQPKMRILELPESRNGNRNGTEPYPRPTNGSSPTQAPVRSNGNQAPVRSNSSQAPVRSNGSNGYGSNGSNGNGRNGSIGSNGSQPRMRSLPQNGNVPYSPERTFGADPNLTRPVPRGVRQPEVVEVGSRRAPMAHERPRPSSAVAQPPVAPRPRQPAGNPSSALPGVNTSQLPNYVLAEMATDAGSREFVMDSDFRWAQDDYNSTQRSIEIWAFIIQLRTRLFLMEQKWSYVGGFTEEKKSKRMRTLAGWCLEQVLQLGPTFIKLGQLFANRTDILPQEFTDELSKLQDRVPAFDSDKALSIVEKELGAPPRVLFRSFDRRPIAAASLGQVHRATLRSGEQVVVKIQRPGLRKLFDIDLANMKQLAALLDKTDPKRDTMGIYEESRATLYQEIDYIQEGKHCDRFRRNFKPYDWVRVPTVYWEVTAPSVITLEYLPGMKITDLTSLRASGLDLEQIATRSTESYIIQVLKHGFLHSDPHAGNLAVSSTGQLIYYDFGMMSVIAPATKDRLLDMFYAVYRQDADAVVACLVDLGIIVQTGDSLPLKRTISYFLENINRQAERQETLSAIGEDLFSLAVDQPFRFPAAFTFVLRAFSTLEGLGKLLIGPEYSFAKVAAPYAQELLDLQAARTFAITEFGKQAAELSVATASMPSNVAKIEGVTRALQQGSLKLRVRDPASERADRKASIVQMATFQAVAVAGLLDVGTQLQLAGQTFYSTPAFVGAAALCGAIGWGFRRVSKLDKFEKDLKSGKGLGPQ